MDTIRYKNLIKIQSSCLFCWKILQILNFLTYIFPTWISFCFHNLSNSNLHYYDNVIFTNVPLFTSRTNYHNTMRIVYNIFSNLLKHILLHSASKHLRFVTFYLITRKFISFYHKILGFVTFCHKTVIFWHKKQQIEYLICTRIWYYIDCWIPRVTIGGLKEFDEKLILLIKTKRLGHEAQKFRPWSCPQFIMI